MNFIVLVLLIFYKSVKNCYEEYKVLYFIIFLFLFENKCNYERLDIILDCNLVKYYIMLVFVYFNSFVIICICNYFYLYFFLYGFIIFLLNFFCIRKKIYGFWYL